MSENIFAPRLPSALERESLPEDTPPRDVGQVERTLLQTARYVVVVLLILLPIFFVPNALVSVGFDKSVLATLAVAIGAIALTMASLQVPKVRTALPLSLGVFWLFVVVSWVSALFSGDSIDALRGRLFESTTAGFVLLLGLVLTLPLALQHSKAESIKALSFFGLSAVVLLAYSLLRIVFGADLADFGQFHSAAVTPIGTLNDLAIFSALILIFGTIALVQLPIKRYAQFLILGLMVLALLSLAIINFSFVWYPLGFFALLLFVYQLSKHALFGVPNSSSTKTVSLALVSPLLVGVVSVLFIAVGGPLSTVISKTLDINYVEVRPSFLATTDIAKAVFQTDPYLGVGPNRFADAWRTHKDPLINETVYWDTDFQTGYGFVPTIFVTTGIIGGGLLMLFHALFLFLGFKMFVSSTRQDPYWSFFGLSAFAAACFLWGMSYVYVPNAGLLLLAALFTGLTYAAAGSLLPSVVRTVSLARTRQRGFVLMAASIITLVVAIGGVMTMGKQYVAQSVMSRAVVHDLPPAEFIAAAQRAYSLYPDDRFSSMQVERHVRTLQDLLAISSPSDDDIRAFQSITELALLTATDALKMDRTDPFNHILLAVVYGVLAQAGTEGAYDMAIASLTNAEELDPQNPTLHLMLANLAANRGDTATARNELALALARKPNYSDALYFSAQLDITEGNTESAIAKARDLIVLEPQNPTRHFQLGVLLSADGDTESARVSFIKAITLDPYYANARYLLALEYLKISQREQALEQLRRVAETNPNDQELQRMIHSIESGESFVPPVTGPQPPVREVNPGEILPNTVIGTVDTNSPLVSPANPMPEAGVIQALQETRDMASTSLESANELASTTEE